jgi:hypothetical protein
MDGCEFTYRLSRRPRMNRGGATLLGYSAFALGMALSALQPSFAPAPAAGWVGWNAAVRRAKPVPMRNRGRLATLTGNP